MKHGPAKQMMIGAANHIANQMGIAANNSHQEKFVPDIKTIPSYERALDMAVIALVECWNVDGILAILQDAKKNNCRIREYTSGELEKLETSNFYIRKGFLKIKKEKCYLKFFLRFGSITITPQETVITKQVVINDKLGEFVRSFQKSLKKIERELKELNV